VSVLDLTVLLAPGTQAYTCANTCRAACCQYIALPLDTPRSARDFDDIRWYLMHEETHVYKNEDGWFLLSMRRCRHLQLNGLCGIYDRRPAICEEYDARECEFTAPVAYDLYFKDDAELDVFLAERKAKRAGSARRAVDTRRRNARA
jgi:Fe-S-cluster containining protein